MKTILKFTAVTALMFTTVVGLAKEPKLSLMTSDQKKSLIVELDSQYKESFLKIIDENQNIIFIHQWCPKQSLKKRHTDRLSVLRTVSEISHKTSLCHLCLLNFQTLNFRFCNLVK